MSTSTMEPANGDFAHSLLVLPLVHGGQILGAITHPRGRDARGRGGAGR